MSVENILSVWALATEEERKAGEQWYPRANAVCSHLAYAHERTLAEVCAVVSVLSPRNRWERNLVDASVVLCGGTNVATFKAGLTKAQTILEAKSKSTEETLALIGQGLKTRNFFLAILTSGQHPSVVVDGHAANILRGWRKPLENTVVTRADYYRISAAYTRAAHSLGVLPSVVQATTWVTWRRLHGITA
jgi:hypothetical protein